MDRTPQTSALPEEPNDLTLALQELAQLVDGAVPGEGSHLIFEGVWASRFYNATPPSRAIYSPMLCVIAQGKKQFLIGEEQYVYDPEHFFLNSVAVPAAGQVIEAAPDKPCLWVMIELDPALVNAVIVEAGLSNFRSDEPLRAMTTSRIDRSLLDLTVQLARLFESPQDASFLKPLLLRAIVYRLLTGPQAARVHQIVPAAGQTQRIAGVIEWLRDNYNKPLTIEGLARNSGMSVSALHHQFKDVTAMSPLQFQKQLRLQEAMRLMLSEGMDVANAGFKVGYDDPSYFSRDYKRFFGVPPRQHIERLRGESSHIFAFTAGQYR